MKRHILDSVIHKLNLALSWSQERPQRAYCVADAASYIGDAMDCEIPAQAMPYLRCARAFLTQNAHFDADIKAAISNVTDALFIVNGAREERLVKALADLVTRCDGEDGVRPDGSNIDTLAAHAVLSKIERGWL